MWPPFAKQDVGQAALQCARSFILSRVRCPIRLLNVSDARPLAI